MNMNISFVVIVVVVVKHDAAVRTAVLCHQQARTKVTHAGRDHEQPP